MSEDSHWLLDLPNVEDQLHENNRQLSRVVVYNNSSQGSRVVIAALGALALIEWVIILYLLKQ